MASRAEGAIFGVRLDDLPSAEQLRSRCADFLDGPGGSRIFTPNPEILLRARTDPTYATLLNSADLALPDGTGVALIESIRRRRRTRRWPGVDVACEVLRLASDRGVTAVFLGGSADAAERSARAWRDRLPGLRIEVVGAGTAFGEDGRAGGADRDAELVEAIRVAGPAVVLVGLGAPKQERWIALHAAELPEVKIFIGVGGAFDIWSGRLRRAPTRVRRLGLEWAWRLVLEPRRLPRILRATVEFPIRALAERR
jgi:N-acetylglucosaminyldiphosphoundecaprenol N-acetyl-beta-D-mannosaminyltransferase